VQLLNVELPIDVTEPGMVTEVKPVQPEKAYVPIEVTAFPMIAEVRPEQPKNA
jgi:hypothetical protein